MTLTAVRSPRVVVATLVILAWAAPAYAHRSEPPRATRQRPLGTREAIELFSPRVRRSTITYLRLRLLELREADLDRARAVIEHRLSIDDLLAEPTPPPHPASGHEKAPGHSRRS
jgi:hypothetical protein